MGTFSHSITLCDASGDRAEVVEALVGTGATFTAIPAPVLERLGIVPHRTVSLRLANGQVERRHVGRVRAELGGVGEVVLCVLAEPGAPAVIGAHTLEACLLAVDPVRMQLVPVEAYWV